jgi:hypothetical protein
MADLEGYETEKKRMIITGLGVYEALKDIEIKGKNGMAILPKGAFLTITKIDFDFGRVLSPSFPGWADWSLPVKKVTRKRLNEEMNK